MKVAKSLLHKITNQTEIFNATLDIYNDALAFDRSGKVERNPKKDLATFSAGKVYHVDLSASYNIGARYFIRAFQKTTSETKWLSLQAKGLSRQ